MNLPDKMFKINRTEVAFVDFQYCHGNDNSIYMKELVFMAGTSVVPNFFLFRPPFDWRELTREGRRKNNYCKKFVNALEWSEGSINYCDVPDVLTPLDSYKYIFVFGKAKKDFLSKYIKSIIVNLENKTSFKNCINYSTSCPLHPDMKFKCAMNNLFKIFVFIETNYQKIEDIVLDEINY